MKIKPVALSLCLILAACGGGGHSGASGPQGAPGKSAYEIWLEQGNTGTEQDFLDSLVSGGKNDDKTPDNPQPDVPGGGNVDWHWNGSWATRMTDMEGIKNAGEYLNALGHGKALEKDMAWDSQNGYKEYTIAWLDPRRQVMVYSEKELDLGNYGTYVTHDGHSVGSYIHNREGAPNNEYLPDKGTIFSGGTLAHLLGTSPEETTLIKGDMHFTYDPVNPVLHLIFDDYYFFGFSRKNDGSYDIKVAGTNATGVSEFDIPTGDFNKKNDENIYFSTGYLKKGDKEEGLGVYQIRFYENGSKTSVLMSGAFGGTKQ